MLCYRCGSHVQDGATACWNCGAEVGEAARRGDGRARPRSQSRVMSVVYKSGDVVGGRYRIDDMIGSGGAGVVYRAKDETSGARVAVKIVNAKLVQTSDDKNVFGRHVAQARRLAHENVASILDDGSEEGRPYFVMPFLEGLSLRKIIDLRKDKGQAFSPTEVEPIVEQLTRALDYAHGQGVVHGNVKPDNVLVLPDLLKLTDFGLLPGLPRKPFLAIQKQRGASFRYLAPEVRSESVLGPGADVYSLGVVLGEMLTGLVHDDAKPDLLRRACATLPAATRNALLSAVARSPKDRPASAAQLIAELRGVAVARPPVVESPAPAVGEHEDPTQRLDMRKHGLAPVDALEGEGTGSFAVDDEMIEAAAPARREAPPTVLREEGQPVRPPSPRRSAPLPPTPELIEADAELSLADEDEEATEAALDAMEAFGALEEISASSIELLEEPGLVIVPADEKARIDAQSGLSATGSVRPEPLPETGPALTGPRTEKATPPRVPRRGGDVALPSPAFGEAASATALGRLDEPAGGLGAATNGLHLPPTNGSRSPPSPHGSSERPQVRPPTVARDAVVPSPSIGAPAPTGVMARPAKKERPMTRPRVSTVGPASTLPAQAPAPAPVPANNRRWLGLVLGLVGALLVGMLIWNQWTIASQNELIERLVKQELAAREAAQKADSAADTAAAKVAEAEAEAEELEATKKREAEAVAAAEAEREKAEAEARRAADAAAKREAEARAEKAGKEAQARREAELAAQQRASEARARAERERQAKAEASRKATEARAAQEAAARERRAAEARTSRVSAARAEARRQAEAQRQAEAARRAAAAKEEAERQAAAERRAEADRSAAARKPLGARSPVTPATARTAAAAASPKAEAPVYERTPSPASEAPEPAAMVAPPDEKPLECPRGMTLVKSGAFMIGAPRNDPERNFGDQDYRSVAVEAFCVDYYEYPNGRGRTPTTGLTWTAANSRCKRRGKRLCTEDEWEKACKGPGGSRYPYANAWDPARCNTEDEEGSDREIVGSGTFRTCRSGYNVFDMGGNVAEWTATKKGSGYVVKGGASDRPGYDSRCASRKSRGEKSKRDNLGFRCCAEPK